MERVLIFGNTRESREMAQTLRRRGKQVVMCVTTEYARSLLPVGTVCHVARLNAENMMTFIRQVNPARVVDATHPYAQAATRNIQYCTKLLHIPCQQVAYENIDEAWREVVQVVSSPEEAVRVLLRSSGNALLNVAAEQLSAFADVDPARLFARIPLTQEALDASTAAGIPLEHLIATQLSPTAPFTAALYELIHAETVVTGDVTVAGGLDTIILPALENGLHVVMIRREQAE